MNSTNPEATNTPPRRQYPASRPGIKFVLCVAAVAIGVIGVIAFN